MRKMFAAAALAAVFFWPAVSHSATFTVPGDYTLIEDAIKGVPDGSTILVQAGVYNENVRLKDLGKNVYLKADGAVTLSGAQTNKILLISNPNGGDHNKNLIFDGFTFADGRVTDTTYSPIKIVDARPVFINCSFLRNKSSAQGGAVLVFGSKASPGFYNCVFKDNESFGSASKAGAVLVNNGGAQATFKDCLFENNSNRISATSNVAAEGGALYFASAGGRIIDSVFRNNSASYAGGAIMALTWFDKDPNLIEINGCRFEGNYTQAVAGKNTPSPTEGGAIMGESNVSIDIRNSYFEGNWAEAGGAVHSYRAHITIVNSVFDGNTAVGKGGVGYGGALGVNLNDAGDSNRRQAQINVEKTVFRNNIAPVGGAFFYQGDLYYNKKGLVTLNDVTIDQNTATTANNSQGNGGGLFLALANATANNVFILNNVAESIGGGMVIVMNTSLTMNDSFIIGNSGIDPAVHNPEGLTIAETRNAWNYNGSDPRTDNVDNTLVAIPPVAVGGDGYLTYLVSPYDIPTIDPFIGPVPNLGGYAAGTIRIGNMTESTAFELKIAGGIVEAQATLLRAFGGRTGSPYPPGAPASLLPGRIETEDFDIGGEGLGYHDNSPTNEGGAYRTGNGVDIVADGAASNAHAASSVEAGEWLEYTVDVGTEAVYNLETRFSSLGGGGQFYVQVDNQDVTGVLTVPDTGGWSSYQVASAGGIFLEKGYHLVRVVIAAGGLKLDCFDWNIASTDPQISRSPASLSYTMVVGQGTASQPLEVWNSGPGLLNYTVDVIGAPSWLTVSPASGNSSGEHDVINVNFTEMAIGDYSATLRIHSDDPPAPPDGVRDVYVTVNFSVIEDPLIFQDDFAFGNVNWTNVSGVWKPTAAQDFISVWTQNDRTVSNHIDLQSFTAGRLETRFILKKKFKKRSNFTLMFGYQYGDRHYYRYVRVVKKNTGWKTIIGQFGDYGGDFHGVKNSVVKRYSYNTWYDLTVDVSSDGMVEVYVNGESILTHTFPGTVPGQVGFQAIKARTKVDDFYVWDEAVIP